MGRPQREGKDRGCGGRDDPARRRRVHRGVGRPAGCALAAVRVCHRSVLRRRRRSLDNAAGRPPRSEDARGVRPPCHERRRKTLRGPAPPGPAYDWVAANRKKKEAIAQLAWLSATMDDVDARINALIERTRDLELD